MLILSRREGEALVIGTDVTIVILGVRGRQVRVGIDAPQSINIRRKEICPSPRRNGNLTQNTVVATAAS
jgi:carbon storage regulator